MKIVSLIKLLTLTTIAGGLVGCASNSTKDNLKSSTLDPIIEGDLKEFIMTSPTNKLTPSIVYDDATRTLYYSLEGQISSISEATGKLGFITTTDDFANSFADNATMTDAVLGHDDYDTISGKSAHVEYYYNKYVLTIKNNLGKEMKIECRVYDTGFAFRYHFSSDGETITKNDPLKYTEQTTFNLYKGSNTRYLYQLSVNSKYDNDYEEEYRNVGSDDSDHKWRQFPFLETQEGKPTVLFAEAGLDGTYCDSCLHRIGDHVLQVTPTYQQLHYDYNFTSRTIKMNNFTSPWRTFIIGDYSDIVTSDLIDALNEKSVIEDTSWIKPGTCSWSWLDGRFDAQSNEAVHKKYIDFASEMGWKYYILDEGWPLLMSNDEAIEKGLVDKNHQDTDHMSKHGFMYAVRTNTPKLVQYAKERNVGLIAWIRNTQLCDPYNDFARMDGVLSSVAAAGFKGIKADYFDYPSQNTDIQLRKLYELCAKYHLVLNVHGSNLPTGERRTYPNVINREAVYGQEQAQGPINPTLIISNAFTRCVVGPTDFTPYVNASDDSHLQLSSQIALPIIFESGATCIASTANVFRDDFMNYNKDIQNFYRNLPSTWKQTKFISGSPVLGKNFSIVIARQARNGDWYVGGVFDDPISSGYDLDLSFLGEGSYHAEVFKGKESTSQLSKFEVIDVTKDTKINFPICDNGGFAVRITNTNNKITIRDASPLTISAYRDDSTNPIASGEQSQLGHKIRLEINAPSADLLPEYVYINDEPFYVKRSESEPTRGTASGINEVYQNIDISVKPPVDTRVVNISCSAGGSVVVCDDLRKYYISGDSVKIGTKLTISFKYDKDVYVVALSLNDVPIPLADDEYSFVVEDTYPSISIKVTYTAKS